MSYYRLLSKLTSLCFFVTIIAQTRPPDSSVTCLPNPVETEVGRNAILSCQHGGDLSRESVEWHLEWNHHGPTQKTVHVTRNGAEDPHSRADLQYQNRTYLDQNQTTEGRVSLTIFNVSEEDAGHYSCLLHIYHTEDEKIHSGKGYVSLVIVDVGSEDEQKNKPNSNNGAIIGGSVGGAAAVIVIAILLIQRKRRRRPYIPGTPYRDHPNGQNEEPNDQIIRMQEL